ncbi:unnamed protein product, partial [Meganyctiphanes norvegica]
MEQQLHQHQSQLTMNLQLHHLQEQLSMELQLHQLPYNYQWNYNYINPRNNSLNGTTKSPTPGTTINVTTTKSIEDNLTTINGTTTKLTEGTTFSDSSASGTMPTSTQGTTVSGTTSIGTTTRSTKVTTVNGTTTTPTGYISNATCVTASENITAEINSLNKDLNDIQSQIQGVTHALIECAMDKNALEKAKVLTQTLRDLLSRLQNILERLQSLQSKGQRQARLIPGFPNSFNVPSLRVVYKKQEGVTCHEDHSSFPESFAALDEALGLLADDPTNTSRADHLYCTGSHLVDAASQVMRSPQVRLGRLYGEADLATNTTSKIDEVIKRVVKEDEEKENLRIFLEKELAVLNVKSKEI